MIVVHTLHTGSVVSRQKFCRDMIRKTEDFTAARPTHMKISKLCRAHRASKRRARSLKGGHCSFKACAVIWRRSNCAPVPRYPRELQMSVLCKDLLVTRLTDKAFHHEMMSCLFCKCRKVGKLAEGESSNEQRLRPEAKAGSRYFGVDRV